MEHNHAEDDLKTIRQIMERTRKASDKGGGWIMVLWGVIWFVGFLGSQFIQSNAIAWVWAGLSSLGMGGTIWLALRMRGKGVSTPFWRPIVFWWVSLIVFDWLLVWLLGIRTGRELMLLILLSVALGYVQFGLFTHWAISATGVVLAALAVGVTLLIPGYFYLAMAVLGGGVLAGSGLWFVHQESRGWTG